MTGNELKIMQSYPLEIKVEKTKARIREWARYWGEDNITVSFSGGKDSTVLLDIVRQEFPNTRAVFCDTGLEYPEIKQFVKEHDNVEILRPKRSFKEVITKYGYPIISKEQSACIYEIRNTKSEYMKERRLNGDSKGRFKLSKKWRFLVEAPFLISDKCCYHLKKAPLYSFERRNKTRPIIGTMTEESMLRLNTYLRYGCNAFETTHPTSKPLSFWKQQDVLQYIKEHDLSIAPVYGDIVEEDDQLKCTGVKRTGCIFCGYGCHREKCPNRFQQLKETHPNLYEYCIEGGQYNCAGMWVPSNKGLGFGKVLDYIGVEY